MAPPVLIAIPPPLLFFECYAASTGAVRAAGTAVTTVANKFDTPDNLFEESKLQPSSGADKRAFTYFMLGGARFLYASAARLAVINVVATLSASADVLALAAVEVDLAQVAPGQTITVKWRGKPVFIKHRTEAQIKEVSATPSDLRHVQSDLERVKDPKWLVTLSFGSNASRLVRLQSGEVDVANRRFGRSSVGWLRSALQLSGANALTATLLQQRFRTPQARCSRCVHALGLRSNP